LPTELEREIFEYSAFSCPGSIPRLVLVASSAEPLLYRMLSLSHTEAHFPRISSSDCLKILDSKSASFLHDHVRCIDLTGVPTETAAPILSSCIGVVFLGIF
ncbi:hypothetical protein B0H13DRAFT_1518013, partial [Mycena leptocephala]